MDFLGFFSTIFDFATSSPGALAGSVICASVAIVVAVWILNNISKIPILGDILGASLFGAILGFVVAGIFALILRFFDMYPYKIFTVESWHFAKWFVLIGVIVINIAFAFDHSGEDYYLQPIDFDEEDEDDKDDEDGEDEE